MPTGIEETLAAIAAALAELAALSTVSNNPNPDGSIEADDSAKVAPAPILDASIQEGASGTIGVADPTTVDPGSGNGAGRSPINGDRPAPSGGVGERHYVQNGQSVTELEYFDADEIVVGAKPAPEPPAPPQPDARPTGDQPSSANQPQRDLPGLTAPPWQPPLIAPTNDPSALPRMTPPAAAGGDAGGGGSLWPPADLADAWEKNHEYSWSKLLFDKSGEKLNQDAKKAVEDKLTEFLDWSPDGSEVPEDIRSNRAVVAGALQTLFDVGFGMLVVPVLDPSSVARGIMRTGVASAEGIEDINQGRTLEGSMKIVGEVSAVVLMVATPIKAVAAKGPPPAAGEATVTMFLKEGAATGEQSVAGAHNSVRVTAPAKGAAPARDIFTDVTRGGSGLEVVAEAAVKDFVSGKAEAQASFTRSVSPEAARKAAAFADAASEMQFKGEKGGIGEFAGRPGEMGLRALDPVVGRTGPFSALGEHCSTYAAAVARAGGILVSGRFGPHATYLMFKYGGAPGAWMAGAGAAGGMMGNNGAAPTAPPPN